MRMPLLQVRHPGVAPARALAAHPASAPLTPREEEVLRLITLGKCHKEIAAAVGISPRTAQFHVSNLLEKFGVATRLELLATIIRCPRLLPA
jgi:two-component system, LuxR family, sensor histidine kinase TtrS